MQTDDRTWKTFELLKWENLKLEATCKSVDKIELKSSWFRGLSSLSLSGHDVNNIRNVESHKLSYLPGSLSAHSLTYIFMIQFMFSSHFLSLRKCNFLSAAYKRFKAELDKIPSCLAHSMGFPAKYLRQWSFPLLKFPFPFLSLFVSPVHLILYFITTCDFEGINKEKRNFMWKFKSTDVKKEKIRKLNFLYQCLYFYLKFRKNCYANFFHPDFIYFRLWKTLKNIH